MQHDADKSFRLQFGAPDLVELVQGSLAAAIGIPSPVRVLDAAELRGHVHDQLALARAQVRQKGLCHAQRPEGVDLEGPAEHVEIHLVDAHVGAIEDARIVDQDVQRNSGKAFRKCRDTSRVGHVQLLDAGGDFGQFRGVSGIAGGAYNSIALFRELLRVLEADTAIGARDQDRGAVRCRRRGSAECECEGCHHGEHFSCVQHSVCSWFQVPGSCSDRIVPFPAACCADGTGRHPWMKPARKTASRRRESGAAGSR